MKLNLGCGVDLREGYVNVDFRRTHPSVREVDLSVFPWPFEDGSATEILMLDFLEHFPYAQTQQILMECYRVLRSDGELVIQVPDGSHLTVALNGGPGSYQCNSCGYDMVGRAEICMGCGQSADDIAEAAMKRLYGGQDYVGNFHQTVFTKRSLRLKVTGCGFELRGWEEDDHQRANWNFKGRFVKGNDIW